MECVQRYANLTLTQLWMINDLGSRMANRSLCAFSLLERLRQAWRGFLWSSSTFWPSSLWRQVHGALRWLPIWWGRMTFSSMNASNAHESVFCKEYVKKLQSKAHEAIRWGRMGSPSSTSLTDAELDRLSGRTCLNSVSGLTFPEPLSSSHSATGSGPVSVSSSTPETSQSLDSIAFDALHPRVAKDMKIFDGRAVEESQSQHQQQQPVHDMWDFSPSPERDDNAMPDVRFGEPNLFSVEVYSGLHVGGYALGCPNVSVSSIGLDPSWLFFLEHLGFHSVML
jgi:hypothetical protein